MAINVYRALSQLTSSLISTSGCIHTLILPVPPILLTSKHVVIVQFDVYLQQEHILNRHVKQWYVWYNDAHWGMQVDSSHFSQTDTQILGRGLLGIKMPTLLRTISPPPSSRENDTIN